MIKKDPINYSEHIKDLFILQIIFLYNEILIIPIFYIDWINLNHLIKSFNHQYYSNNLKQVRFEVPWSKGIFIFAIFKVYYKDRLIEILYILKS